MRILHCIPTMGEGGSELQLSYLASAQVGLGDEVHVAVGRHGPRSQDLVEAGVALHPVDPWGNHDPSLAWKLARLVWRLRPHVVQTWLRQMDVFGGMASRWVGVPWLLSERASAAAYPAGVKHALRVRIARRASAIVSNSHAGDTYWASRVGAGVRRWVVSNAVPVSEIAAAEPARDDVLSLPEGHRMLLFVGRLTPEKNAENLILAISRLAPVVPVVVYFCGVGPDEAKLRRLAKANGLAQTIRFVGFVSSIWSWMKRADALVQVSHFEGQPNAVLEAIACGRPIVFSDIPAHRELLDERGCFFVDPASPESICDGLRACLMEPGVAAQRADVAKLCLRNRSPEEVARMYRAIYEEIVGTVPSNSRERQTTCAG